MDRKVWFFGDSFTEGWQLSKIKNNLTTGQEEYYIDVLQKKGQKWTERVADLFKGEEVNCGTGGSSNERIIFSIIKQLKNIQPGDVVFLSNSHELRFLIPDSIGGGLLDFNAGRLAEEGLEEYHTPNLPSNSKSIEALVDFALDFRVEHSSLWKDAFLLIFSYFEQYFKSRNIECYFWDYSIWMESHKFKFERIVDATNGGIDDLHFSLKGHSQFFEYIKNNIDSLTLKNFSTNYIIEY